ncbi:MAG: ATP-binding protein [Gammaproteobacteria bacterium]
MILKFTEFLKFKNNPKNKNQFLKEYMEYGAFPAIVNREVFKKELLNAYFEDFIYKDIVSRHQVNPQKIKELAIYLASNSSKLFSYRNVAAALNCHSNTVMDYMAYLKEIFLFEELHKFHFSLQKQYGNSKKIYCLDTGLAAAVSFKFSEDKGRILENLVYLELRRRKLEIYFHKVDQECDFLIKKELSIVAAIQVCVSLSEPRTKEREINGLLEALETYKLKKGLILTESESGIEIIEREGIQYEICIMPIVEWFLNS